MIRTTVNTYFQDTKQSVNPLTWYCDNTSFLLSAISLALSNGTTLTAVDVVIFYQLCLLSDTVVCNVTHCQCGVCEDATGTATSNIWSRLREVVNCQTISLPVNKNKKQKLLIAHFRELIATWLIVFCLTKNIQWQYHGIIQTQRWSKITEKIFHFRMFYLRVSYNLGNFKKEIRYNLCIHRRKRYDRLS